VRHTAGWLRYRIATAPAEAFGIETPFLDLVVDDAVLDVTVGETETEVAVVSGRVRVKTLDERRQIDLRAGYTGYASLEGDPLAIRRGPGQGLEAVPPVVMPALHPNRAASAGVAPAAAGAGTPAIAAFAGRAPAPAEPPVPGTAQPPALAASPAAPAATPAIAAPATAPAPRSLIVAPLAQAPLAQAPLAQAPLAQAPLARAEAGPAAASAVGGPAARSSDSEPAEQIRRRFEGLTEGLLDGLLPALPQGDGR
jgi:hypothetical protein